MSYTAKWTDKGVIITMHEDSVVGDIMRSNNEIYSHPKFEQLKYQIVDFRKAKEFSGSEIEAKTIGIMDKSSSRWNSSMKVVCITKDPRLVELIEIYAKMLSETEWVVKICESMDEAKAFVGS